MLLVSRFVLPFYVLASVANRDVVMCYIIIHFISLMMNDGSCFNHLLETCELHVDVFG